MKKNTGASPNTLSWFNILIMKYYDSLSKFQKMENTELRLTE